MLTLVHPHLVQLLLQRLHSLLQLLMFPLQLLNALRYPADIGLGALDLSLGDLSLDHLGAHPAAEGLLAAAGHRA